MTPNPHRGSDFNDFLAEEGLTPTMTPTPRTDAMRLKMAQLGWPSDGEPVAMLMTSHGELERELADLREQVAILRSDEKRLMQFAKTYRLRADEAEAKLEQERQDRKQADLDALRALGERNDARAELAVWHHEAKRLGAELAKFDETAIEWWCEYQDLKAKAREP
jgi:chromosome segregation ATPase